MSTDYRPINCSYYDELEAIATLRKRVQLIYESENGPVTLESVGILNLYAKEKEEFVVLTNGQTIRLDYLVEVDGKPVIKAC
jgi:Rho-binding antiterminator